MIGKLWKVHEIDLPHLGFRHGPIAKLRANQRFVHAAAAKKLVMKEPAKMTTSQKKARIPIGMRTFLEEFNIINKVKPNAAVKNRDESMKLKSTGKTVDKPPNMAQKIRDSKTNILLAKVSCRVDLAFILLLTFLV